VPTVRSSDAASGSLRPRRGYASSSTLAAAAPGSYLAITHPASDVAPEASARASRAYNENVTTPQTRRSHDEVARFFTGLELVAPGLVQLPDWRPAAGDLAAPTSGYGAVARKP
jgi:S-adenosyl methyltransferase